MALCNPLPAIFKMGILMHYFIYCSKNKASDFNLESSCIGSNYELFD